MRYTIQPTNEASQPGRRLGLRGEVVVLQPYRLDLSLTEGDTPQLR